MMLRDSIQDATLVKSVLEGLIRRADTYGKSREDILMELQFLVEDAQKSIDKMDKEMYQSFETV
jgi:hypothetical protein